MQAIIDNHNVAPPTVVEGDAGVILKADGTFRIFNTDLNIDPNHLTDGQLAIGKKLIVIAAVLQDQKIQDLIMTSIGATPIMELKLDS